MGINDPGVEVKRESPAIFDKAMGDIEAEVNRYKRLVNRLGSIVFLPSPQEEGNENVSPVNSTICLVLNELTQSINHTNGVLNNILDALCTHFGELKLQ